MNQPTALTNLIQTCAATRPGAPQTTLSIIGLSKNVGKTTVLNHLLATSPLAPDRLGLTSLGLDGEALDALTGLPKPRIAPAPGLLLATARSLLARGTAAVEVLEEAPGRTALGAVIIGRVQSPGQVELAGPTLLADLASASQRLGYYGARLVLLDGAINRLGAAAPEVADACILCTGATVGASVQVVARRTVEVLERLETPLAPPDLLAAFAHLPADARLATCTASGEMALAPLETLDPSRAATWLIEQTRLGATACRLRGAFSDDLARALLQADCAALGEMTVILSDPTRLFAASVLLRQLAARSVRLWVAKRTPVLAVTLSPFAPGGPQSTEPLAEAIRALCPAHPPLVDVIAGFFLPAQGADG